MTDFSDLKYKAGTTAPPIGSLLIYNGDSWVPFSPGTTGQVLKSATSTSNPSWGNASDLTIAGATRGDVLFYDGTNWVRLAKGTAGQRLQIGANDPAWAAGGGLGVTDASNATSGYIGEVLQTVQAAAVGSAFVSTEFGNVTSRALTAGDWLVSGTLNWVAGTFTVMKAAVSVNSGNTTTDHVVGSNEVDYALTVAGAASISDYRVNVSGATTVYLKAALTGTPADIFTGRITAQRIR